MSANLIPCNETLLTTLDGDLQTYIRQQVGKELERAVLQKVKNYLGETY